MRKIMIDCPQEIPCNPCQSTCPTGAIVVRHLTDRPETFPEKCIACGSCVAGCPGQACFLVDEEWSPEEATVDFPFEFLPAPQVGEVREARDNQGNTVCLGRVVRVQRQEKWHGTLVVRLAVPKDQVRKVRGMARTPVHTKEV